MASEGNLPTAAEMLANAEAELDRAYRALSDAADWLRADWRPLGSNLTTEQAQRRILMGEAVSDGKRAINKAKGRK